MDVGAEQTSQAHPFQAEVAELLNLMVHSVYSETDVFLRELISNASDACDKVRYEAIAKPVGRKRAEGDGDAGRHAREPEEEPIHQRPLWWPSRHCQSVRSATAAPCCRHAVRSPAQAGLFSDSGAPGGTGQAAASPPSSSVPVFIASRIASRTMRASYGRIRMHAAQLTTT